MNSGKFVLAQLLDCIHPQQFQRCVQRHGGDYKVSQFSCWSQFVCLAFAQLTWRESLRDIESFLNSRGAQLYHLGLAGPVRRSTLADANAARDWRICADLAQGFCASRAASTRATLCRWNWPRRFRRWMRASLTWASIFVLGRASTTPAPGSSCTPSWTCAGLCPPRWKSRPAACRRFSGWIPWPWSRGVLPPGPGLHGLPPALRHRAGLGVVCHPRAQAHELWPSPLPARGSRGLRAQRPGHPAPWFLCAVKLSGQIAARALLRRPEPAQRVFLTNHFELPAQVISDLYRQRWQVELFFKWIKQHLRIQAFYGCSDNAVRTQIWVGLCVYAMVAILRKQTQSQASLFEIRQILSVNAFDKSPIKTLLAGGKMQDSQITPHNQLPLFEL